VVDVIAVTDLGLASAAIIQACSLTALWLRLRWRVKQEHAHREYLVAVLQTLPEGGQVNEQGADGARLTITYAPRGGEVDDE
jgi:hypothetical protein